MIQQIQDLQTYTAMKSSTSFVVVSEVSPMGMRVVSVIIDKFNNAVRMQ